MNETLTHIVIFLVLMVFAIPLHEFGHALAADLCGDDIPALQKRVTVEPWAHWDLLGSLLMALAIFGNLPVIGWGKPVVTDPSHYRNGRWGRFLVAIAGIAVNLLLAVVGAIIFRALHLGSGHADSFYGQLVFWFVVANVSLAVFNLLPVPPLDGSKVLSCLWPAAAARYEQALQGRGMIVLYLLVFFGSSLVSVPVTEMTRRLLGL